MRGALDAIAGLLTDGRCDAVTLDWAALRCPHTTAVRSRLADGRYAPATANRHLAALRGVLKECWRLGYVTADDFRRAADLEAIRGSRLPRGRALKGGEVRALFDSCVQTAKSAQATIAVRDAALLAILYGSGLRRAEVVALDLEHVDREHGRVLPWRQSRWCELRRRDSSLTRRRIWGWTLPLYVASATGALLFQ